MNATRAAAVGAGVLAANALPHAYAATIGARQMTPLRGRTSGPATNAVWSAMNAAAAFTLARRTLRGSTPGERRLFAAGVAGFSVWGLAGEWLFDFNGERT